MNKINKEQMQDVRYIILIFFIIGICFMGNAQSILGTYQQIKPSLSSEEMVIEYNLEENGKFYKKKFLHLEYQIISGGE